MNSATINDKNSATINDKNSATINDKTQISPTKNAHQNNPNKGQIVTPIGPNKMLNIRGNICQITAEYSPK